MLDHYIFPGADVNELLTLLLEYGTDGILLTDATGLVLAVNKSYSMLFHIPVSEVLGCNVLELVEEGAWSPNLFQRVVKKQGSLSIVQTTRTGSAVLSTGTPIFDNKGGLQYVLFNDRDMSLQSLLESDSSSPVEVTVHADSKDEQTPETEQFSLNNIVVQNAVMKKQLQLALRVAKYPIPILLTGESGVGKSMVARFIHDQSPRRQGPFVAINCGAIPDQLVESELFGHKAGAFTGARSGGKKGRIETAEGGTLFLDEISELPYILQVKLLQFLETKQVYPVGSTTSVSVDCAVVAATNRRLSRMIADKTFRDDLYYRLNGIPIHLPPLRERREEIPPLAEYFLEQYSIRFDIKALLTSNAVIELQKLPFEGNIRELSYLIQRLLIVADGGKITAQHVRSWAESDTRPNSNNTTAYSGTLAEQVSQFERDLIWQTIQDCGNQEKAAKVLGVHQSTLSRKR